MSNLTHCNSNTACKHPFLMNDAFNQIIFAIARYQIQLSQAFKFQNQTNFFNLNFFFSDSVVNNVIGGTSPTIRRRFSSGTHLNVETSSSSSHLSVETLSTYERRKSTFQPTNSIRHRSGSFNPNILTQRRPGKNFFSYILKQF